MNKVKLSPANITILAAGALMLIASFMAFYKYTITTTLDGSQTFSRSVSINAWDRGAFLIATLPAFLGMLMAVQVGLVAFGNIDMPNRLLGLTWDQVHLALSVQATLLMLTFLAQARPSVPIEVTFGIGFWLMLLGAIALVVGALMRMAGTARRPRAV